MANTGSTRDERSASPMDAGSATSSPDNGTRRRALLTLGVLCVGGAAWLHSQGHLEGMSDPERIRALVLGFGGWGPLVFMALAMALMPLFLFGPPVWASMLVWSWPQALLYSYIAAVLSSLITYALARRGAGGEARIPEKLRHYGQGLLQRPISTVIVLRLLLWANPVADLLIAVSGVSLRHYLLGTFIGMLPPTVLHVFIGAGIQQVDNLPGEVWLAGGAAAAIAAIAAIGVALRRRAARRSASPQ